MVEVYHAYYTNERKRENGETWIMYWERITNTLRPSKCPCCGKTLSKIKEENPRREVEMVGAHVKIYIEYADDNAKLYITPTCNICNDTYKKKVSLHDRKIFQVPEDYIIEAKEKD